MKLKYLFFALTIFITVSVFGKCDKYKTVMEGSTENLLKKLAQVIKERPENYFTYLSFAETLAMQDKNINKSVNSFFPKNTFQNQFLKALTYRAKGNRKKAANKIKTFKNIPFSPLITINLLKIDKSCWPNVKNNINLSEFEAKEITNFIEAKYVLKKDFTYCLQILTPLIKNLNKYKYDETKMFLVFSYLNLKIATMTNMLDVQNEWETKLEPFLKTNNTCETYSVLISASLYTLYSTLQDYKKNEYVVGKAIKIAEKYHLLKYKYFYKLYLSKIMQNKGDIDKAIKNLENCVQYFKKINDKGRLGIAYRELGILYDSNSMPSTAREYITQAIYYLKPLNKNQYTYALYRLGKIELQLNNYTAATTVAHNIIQLSEKNNWETNKLNGYSLLAEALIKSGKVKEGMAIANKCYLNCKDSKLYKNIFLSHLLLGSVKLKDTKKLVKYAKLINYNEFPYLTKVKLHQLLYEGLSQNKPKNLLYYCFSHYRAYKHLKQAHQYLQQFDLSSLKTPKEKLDYLSNNQKVSTMYGNVTEKFYKSLFLNIVLVFLIFFAIVLTIKWKKHKNKNIIGAYRVVNSIGLGGMGEVFKAISLKDNKTVAIKTLRPELVNDQQKQRRFNKEVEILKQLDHPNVLKYIDHGTHKDRQYIVTEFIDGITLSSLVKERWPLHKKSILFIVREIVKGMAYLHSKEIIHRDLKLSNIMVEERHFSFSSSELKPYKKIVIMDLGLSKDLDLTPITNAGNIIGTPEILAPECVLEHITSKKTDIYSFGVIFYQLVAGVAPFSHHDSQALMYQIMHTEPKKPSEIAENIPPEFEKIIMKCLERFPKDRYESFDEIHTCLNNLHI